MDNPFVFTNRPLSENEAKRVVAVCEAFSDLFEILKEHCQVPSRYHSVAVTLLEQSASMAVKSINKEALP